MTVEKLQQDSLRLLQTRAFYCVVNLTKYSQLRSLPSSLRYESCYVRNRSEKRYLQRQPTKEEVYRSPYVAILFAILAGCFPWNIIDAPVYLSEQCRWRAVSCADGKNANLLFVTRQSQVLEYVYPTEKAGLSNTYISILYRIKYVQWIHVWLLSQHVRILMYEMSGRSHRIGFVRRLEST